MNKSVDRIKLSHSTCKKGLPQQLLLPRSTWWRSSVEVRNVTSTTAMIQTPQDSITRRRLRRRRRQHVLFYPPPLVRPDIVECITAGHQIMSKLRLPILLLTEPYRDLSRKHLPSSYIFKSSKLLLVPYFIASYINKIVAACMHSLK